MRKPNGFNLLRIPEGGGKTTEYKITPLGIYCAWAAGLALLAALLFGLWSFWETRRLGEVIVRLNLEKADLREDVDRIDQLEQVLSQVQQSNRQLRALLSGAMGLELAGEPKRLGRTQTHYISTLERLRWGRVRSVPNLWPVRGRVRLGFGSQFQALVIEAASQSLVRASAGGQVSKSGYEEGLGYVVVVDHGNGLVTKYGYTARVLVREGQHLQKGQPIALVGYGPTGLPELYFAVREAGKWRDPLEYRIWL